MSDALAPPELDDFGRPIGDVYFDAKTMIGAWATMSPESWIIHGVGRLGPGLGQGFAKQSDETWKKMTEKEWSLVVIRETFVNEVLKLAAKFHDSSPKHFGFRDIENTILDGMHEVILLVDEQRSKG